jgi:hypothetical protein
MLYRNLPNPQTTQALLNESDIAPFSFSILLSDHQSRFVIHSQPIFIDTHANNSHLCSLYSTFQFSIPHTSSNLSCACLASMYAKLLPHGHTLVLYSIGSANFFKSFISIIPY